jgi:hypothetical protein
MTENQINYQTERSGVLHFNLHGLLAKHKPPTILHELATLLHLAGWNETVRILEDATQAADDEETRGARYE